MSDARLLYLGNGTKLQSVAQLDDRFESWGLTVDRFWAYSGEFPKDLDSYNGIFLSGSPHGAYEDIPFIHREHCLIQDAAARGIPILGICFGSQILASALCGRDQVFRRDDCEIATRIFQLQTLRATTPSPGGWRSTSICSSGTMMRCGEITPT